MITITAANVCVYSWFFKSLWTPLQKHFSVLHVLIVAQITVGTLYTYIATYLICVHIFYIGIIYIMCSHISIING